MSFGLHERDMRRGEWGSSTFHIHTLAFDIHILSPYINPAEGPQPGQLTLIIPATCPASLGLSNKKIDDLNLQSKSLL
ncbi:hypothetical protein ABKN59_006866 [Abortiporus biennis]